MTGGSPSGGVGMSSSRGGRKSGRVHSFRNSSSLTALALLVASPSTAEAQPNEGTQLPRVVVTSPQPSGRSKAGRPKQAVRPPAAPATPVDHADHRHHDAAQHGSDPRERHPAGVARAADAGLGGGREPGDDEGAGLPDHDRNGAGRRRRLVRRRSRRAGRLLDAGLQLRGGERPLQRHLDRTAKHHVALDGHGRSSAGRVPERAHQH